MRLSITTPRGALVDADADEFVAPGVLGELGVLPGHVALLSALRPGVLVYRTKDHAGTVALGNGFLEVIPGTEGKPDRALVIVDQAVHAKDVDRAAAEQELAAADAAVARWKGDPDGEYHTLLARRAWAQARADAAARSTQH